MNLFAVAMDDEDDEDDLLGEMRDALTASAEQLDLACGLFNEMARRRGVPEVRYFDGK